MFKLVQGPEGPLTIPKQVLTVARQMTDDWYDLSLSHSNRQGSISCERTAFIGYLSEALHYAMHDIYGETSSFYELCKSNDDNIIGNVLITRGRVIKLDFNVFNSLGLNMPYAAQRAGDFCWEVFADIRVKPMEKHLWNVEIDIDLDLIEDFIQMRMSRESL